MNTKHKEHEENYWKASSFIVKLLKTNDKEKPLKAARREKKAYYLQRGKKIRVIALFLIFNNTMLKGTDYCIKALKEKMDQSRILYP